MAIVNSTSHTSSGISEPECTNRNHSNLAMFVALSLVIAVLAAACASSGDEPAESRDTSAVLWVVSDDPLAPDSTIIVDAPPVPACEVVPEYPEALRFSGVEGVVWMRILVSDNGTVMGAVVKKSSGYRQLDVAALRAAVRTPYKPAILNGRPLAVWKTYSVTFRTPDRA
jgi:TonB family protein